MDIKKFNRIVFYLIMLMTVLVPMAYSNNIVRVFDLSKGATLKIGGSLISLIWLVGVIYFKEYKNIFKNNLYNSLALSFLVLAGVSTFFSTNSWTSFFGVYERQLGFYGISCAVLLSVILNNIIDKDDKTYLNQFLYTIMIAGSIVSFQTIFQEMGINPLSVIKGKEGFVSGIMGHSNFLGSFLAITSIITISSVYYFRNEKAVFWLFSVSSVIQITTLLLTRSRGAFAAFVFAMIFSFCVMFIRRIASGEKKYAKLLTGIVIFCFNFLYSCFLVVRYKHFVSLSIFLMLGIGILYLIYKFNEKYKVSNFKILGLIFIVTLTISSGVNFTIMKKSGYEPYKDYPGAIVPRIYSIFTLSTTTTARYLLWQDTLKILTKYPITGMGLENFRTQFMRYKSHTLHKMEPHVNYDNPHNSYLYYFVSLGIVGCFFYFLIFVFIGRKLIKSKEIVWISTFSCFFILYIPSFDTNELVTLFWICVGMLFSYYPIEKKIKFQYGYNLSVFIIFTLLVNVSVFQIIQYVKADSLMLESMKEMKKKNANKAIRLVDEALEINPKEHFYNLQKVKYFNLILKSIRDNRAKMAIVSKANDQITKYLDYSWAPENAFINLVNTYLTIKDYKRAYHTCNKVLEYSPHLDKVKVTRSKLEKFK